MASCGRPGTLGSAHNLERPAASVQTIPFILSASAVRRSLWRPSATPRRRGASRRRASRRSGSNRRALPLRRHSGTLNHTAAHGRNQNRDRSARQGQSLPVHSDDVLTRHQRDSPRRGLASSRNGRSERPLSVGGMYGQPRAAGRIGAAALARREVRCPAPTEIQPIAATALRRSYRTSWIDQ